MEFEFNADISHIKAENITQGNFYIKTFAHNRTYPYLLSETSDSDSDSNSDSKTSKKKNSNYYERVWGWYDENIMAEMEDIIDDPFYYNEHCQPRS